MHPGRVRATIDASSPRARARVAAACLVVAGVAAGCARPLGVPVAAKADRSATVYFPVTIGSTWTYRVEDFALGYAYDRTLRVSGRASLSDLGADAVVVEETYSTGEPIPGVAVVPVAYYWRDGYLERTFLVERDGQAAPLDWPSIERILPATLEPGTRWESPPGAEEGGGSDEDRPFFDFEDPAPVARRDLGFWIGFAYRVTAVNDRVVVPAGSFEACARVDSVARQRGGRDDAGVLFFYADWYAPGVGLVRSRVWDDPERKHERVRVDLVGYAIAP